MRGGKIIEFSGEDNPKNNFYNLIAHAGFSLPLRHWLMFLKDHLLLLISLYFFSSFYSRVFILRVK